MLKENHSDSESDDKDNPNQAYFSQPADLT